MNRNYPKPSKHKKSQRSVTTYSKSTKNKQLTSFRTRDCLHIKAQFNEDWWIGRVIKSNAPIGFVPTPMKLKKLVLEAAAQMGPQKDTSTL